MSGKIISRIFGASDAFGTLRPILTLGFFFGLAPFRIYGSHGKKYIACSYLSLIPSILQAIAFGTALTVVIWKDESLVGFFLTTKVTKIGDLLQIGIGTIGMIMLLTASAFYRKKFIFLMDLLTCVDKELEALGVRLNYNEMLKITYLGALAMGSVAFGFLIGSYFLLESASKSLSITIVITFFLPHYVIAVSSAMIASVSKVMFSRFKVLNQLLLNLLNHQSINIKPIYIVRRKHRLCEITKNSKTVAEIIQETTKINDMIVDVWRVANDFFSYQLLTVFCVGFITILFNGYYIMDAFFEWTRNPNNTKIQTFVIFFLSQVIYYVVEIFTIVDGGSDVIDESQRTATYVHRLMNTVKDEELRTNLSYLSMQLLHRELRFTAAGFFNIDRTLCLSMAGTCTTYLIILLQFASNDPLKTLVVVQDTIKKEITNSAQ